MGLRRVKRKVIALVNSLVVQFSRAHNETDIISVEN